MQQAVTGTTPDNARVSAANEPDKIFNLTRRSLFGAAGGVVVGLTPVAAQAVASVHPSDWKRAVDAYAATEEAIERFLLDAYHPAEEEISRRAPTPSRKYRVPRAGGRYQEYEARIEDFEWLCEDGECGPAVRPIRAAWEKWREDFAAAERDLGWNKLEAECERLYLAGRSALDVVLETPAPDVAAVHYKLRLAWDRCWGEEERYHPLIMADLSRLSEVMQ